MSDADRPTPEVWLCICDTCADIFYGAEDASLCGECATMQRGDTVPMPPPCCDINERPCVLPGDMDASGMI